MRRLVAVGAGWGWAAVASRRGGRRSPGPDYEGIYYAKFYGHGRVLAGGGGLWKGGEKKSNSKT